jgi:hypothetical protein
MGCFVKICGNTSSILRPCKVAVLGHNGEKLSDEASQIDPAVLLDPASHAREHTLQAFSFSRESMMAKTLCKIKKLLKEDPATYVQHVHKPKFVCRSCGRVANSKGLLCAPLKIKDFKKSAK